MLAISLITAVVFLSFCDAFFRKAIVPSPCASYHPHILMAFKESATPPISEKNTAGEIELTPYDITAIALELPAWGLLSVRGQDRQKFLHDLSTNSFMATEESGSAAAVGSSVYTTFTNAQGRLLFTGTAVILHEEVLLLCEPSGKGALLEYLNRFIFPSDRVHVLDVAADVTVLSLSVLERIAKSTVKSEQIRALDSRSSSMKFNSFGLDGLERESFVGESVILVPATSELCMTSSDSNESSSTEQSVMTGSSMCIVRHNSNTSSSASETPTGGTYQAAIMASLTSMLSRELSLENSKLTVNDPTASTAPTKTVEVLLGRGSTGHKWWDSARRIAGRPTMDREVKYNVTALECGLMHALHFRKGCFLGQESISKTVSMNAVRRRLCVLTLDPSHVNVLKSDALTNGRSAVVMAGDLLVDQEGDVVGVVTSGTGLHSEEDAVGQESHTATLPALESIMTFSVDARGQILQSDSEDTLKRSSSKVAVDTARYLEEFTATRCLALLKTSLASGAVDGTSLFIKRRLVPDGEQSIPGQMIPIVAVGALPYPTYDKESSPGPPIDRNNKAAKLRPTDSTASLQASAEEMERKAAKLAETAKKIAALKAKRSG